MMISDDLISSIRAMRPAVPAKDYAASREFYEALGFQSRSLGTTLTEMALGPYSFLLQDFFVEEFAHNFVMHMSVERLDQWWAHIESLALERRFKVRAPIAPRLEPWGLRVAYLFDPAGVLWHLNARP